MNDSIYEKLKTINENALEDEKNLKKMQTIRDSELKDKEIELKKLRPAKPDNRSNYNINGK